MKLIILISILIILLFFINNNYEAFSENDIINLGSNLVKTNHNIFYGFDSKQSEEIKEKLKDFEELDLSKSNIFINENQIFDDINIDNNKIISSDLNSFKYHDASENNRRITFKDINDNEIFYNHETQRNTNIQPNKLCIGNQCIERKHLSMISGNNTIKLKNVKNNTYLQPHSLHYSGVGGIFKSYNQSNDPKSQNIFYNMTNLGNPKCDQRLNSDIVSRYNMFTRFGLQAPNGKFLRAYRNGFIDLAPHLLQLETFTIPSYLFGFFSYFINSESRFSGPLGLMSWHGRFLCHERHWLHGCKSIKAIWNRSRWSRWETMAFITAFDTVRKDLSVYIYSFGCGGFLSTQAFVHFTKSLNPKYCKFRIVPIYEDCSESCKADYLSKSACCGSDEKKIPKNLSCPRDRPKCRFYDQKGKILGKCFKETPNDINGNPVFNQLSPHHCKFATANRSGASSNYLPNLTDNDTMFNEYTITMAKNENNQLYEKDVINHIHKHD